MKSALLTGYGRDLEVATVPDPEILSPTDVIVRVGAAGICRTDLHIQEGQLQGAHDAAGIRLPFICGHETAGWVEETGSAVTHLRKGDAVLLHPVATCGFCRACRAGDDMHCSASTFPGVFAPGGFAEFVRTGARALLPIPQGLEPSEVASLGCAGLTVYHAVKKAIPLAFPGSFTVVLGVGGLGHLAVQLLRVLSATTIIAVDRSPAALEQARICGADHIVVAADDTFVEEVRSLTAGRGAEVVLDCIGEHGVQNKAVGLLANKGTDFLIGYGGELTIDILGQALFPEASFVGNICGTYNELAELLALAGRRSVRLTSSLFDLGAVNVALDRLRRGDVVGRAVLVPESL